MAVEIKYVVIREGEEKMSFASKKEADAYDKMLDLAEVLNDWLVTCPLELDEAQRDNMSMWLAERKDALQGNCRKQRSMLRRRQKCRSLRLQRMKLSLVPPKKAPRKSRAKQRPPDNRRSGNFRIFSQS